jgi:CTD kinase subunit beta
MNFVIHFLPQNKKTEAVAMASQRTLVALQFPPHVVALACIYLAALLSTFEQNDANAPPESQNNLKIVATLRDRGPWEKKFQAQVDDLEGEPWPHQSPALAQ